jgi:hypothetical protein
MGQQLRYAFLAGVAARYADHCMVLADPRLIPLLARTFPSLDLRPRSMFPAFRFDYVTDYYDLYSLFGTSAANIEDLYQPLQPDPAEVQKFSTRYRGAGRKPLIGISWATKSRGRSPTQLSYLCSTEISSRPCPCSIRWRAKLSFMTEVWTSLSIWIDLPHRWRRSTWW